MRRFSAAADYAVSNAVAVVHARSKHEPEKAVTHPAVVVVNEEARYKENLGQRTKVMCGRLDTGCNALVDGGEGLKPGVERESIISTGDSDTQKKPLLVSGSLLGGTDNNYGEPRPRTEGKSEERMKLTMGDALRYNTRNDKRDKEHEQHYRRGPGSREYEYAGGRSLNGNFPRLRARPQYGFPHPRQVWAKPSPLLFPSLARESGNRSNLNNKRKKETAEVALRLGNLGPGLMGR
ncbi:hypothetical protein BJV78DRAFT_1157919 [Lactifluus subvellereus]|nr:hypothetical protein BJV78DRAFT_1157919 [Lactifluus subvellereus]